MRSEDLREFVRREPFQPFRIHLSDGTTYEVRHPELVLVERTKALICFPAADAPPPAIERYEAVALLHITRLEPVQATPAA